MISLALALILFVVFVAIACPIAIYVGGAEHRRATWGYLATIVATQAASLLGPRWHGPEFGVMLVDAVFAAFLASLAGRSARWWPIWAAACQVAGTLSHLMPVVVSNLPKTIYLTIQPLWGFLVLGVILWGVWADRNSGLNYDS